MKKALLPSALCLGLAACISIPKSAPDYISPEGGQAIGTTVLGPWVWVRNASILPGTRPYKKFDPAHSKSCTLGPISMQLDLHAEARIGSDPEQLALACGHLAEAVRLAAHWQGLEPKPVDIRLIFVAPDTRGIIQYRDLALFSAPRLRFVLPSLDDEEETLGHAISSTAHESFHFLARLARRGKRLADDEDIAYRIGSCARFSILGSLPRDKTRYLVNAQEVLPAEAARSSLAAMRLQHLLQPIFGEADVIHHNTPQGEALQTLCNQIPAMVEQARTQPTTPQ